MHRLALRLAVTALVVFGLLVPAALPTRAITGNFKDDLVHPYVGLVAFFDQDGDYMHRCSGSLLTAHIFLTAGHCTAPEEDPETGEVAVPTTAYLYFHQDASGFFSPERGVPPTLCDPAPTDPLCATSDELFNYGFDDFAGFPNNRDLGLIILDQTTGVSDYAALAGVGTLDRLATRRGQHDLTFTLSGYGLSDPREHPESRFLNSRERLMAEAKLVNLRNALTDGFNL